MDLLSAKAIKLNSRPPRRHGWSGRTNTSSAGQDDKALADVHGRAGQAQPRNAGATYLNAVLMVRAGKYSATRRPSSKSLGPSIQRFPRALYFQALAAANLGQNEIGDRLRQPVCRSACRATA